MIFLPSARQDVTRKPPSPGPKFGVCSNGPWTSSRTLPLGLRDARHRGDERRGDRVASGTAARDGEDPASSRPTPPATGPRRDPVVRRERGVSLRRGALRPDHGGRPGAAWVAGTPGGVTSGLGAVNAPEACRRMCHSLDGIAVVPGATLNSRLPPQTERTVSCTIPSVNSSAGGQQERHERRHASLMLALNIGPKPPTTRSECIRAAGRGRAGPARPSPLSACRRRSGR